MPDDSSIDSDALEVARAVAAELAAEGAHAVWLAGSHARADAVSHARADAVSHSDIDIGVIAEPGDGPAYRLDRRDGHLLSVAWTTAEATRASFDDPAVLGAAVPGWRGAVLLHDPEGIAAALQREAQAWDWERLGDRPHRWVGEQVTGYAEEVHKLVAAMEAGDGWGAAVQRSALALRLAPILSVHHRILYDSEHSLWSLVSEAMGRRWADLQASALAARGEGLAESASAALRLYALAVAEVRPLLDERQSNVVEHALEIARAAIVPDDDDEE